MAQQRAQVDDRQQRRRRWCQQLRGTWLHFVGSGRVAAMTQQTTSSGGGDDTSSFADTVSTLRVMIMTQLCEQDGEQQQRQRQHLPHGC
ncbi:hypothetical protein PF003_g13270 [Phytophthora fragariae]|nr:hypothetical protein PF003_g13270 [Phytophthora fragariae]